MLPVCLLLPKLSRHLHPSLCEALLDGGAGRIDRDLSRIGREEGVNNRIAYCKSGLTEV